MYSFLLVIIYMAFISLGLPDSLVGSAWPVMHTELNVPVSYAGMITMVIAAGTVVSSLLSDRLTKRFGAGLVTAVSVFMIIRIFRIRFLCPVVPVGRPLWPWRGSGRCGA